MTMTIMTVDDSRTMRQLLQKTLQTGPYRIIEAEDGLDALVRLDEETPDLIITDINMPRLDGFGLIERLRDDARAFGVPILVLTTETTPEKKARAKQAGATGWIEKPFDPVKLLNTVRSLLA